MEYKNVMMPYFQKIVCWYDNANFTNMDQL